MKKIRLVKNTCYDWLINFIREPLRKCVGCFRDKVISLFETITPKQTVHGKERTLICVGFSEVRLKVGGILKELKDGENTM